MTTREQEILTLLRSNPLISQSALAKALGITRSSVAVHITNLMKKGVVLGKGYILREERYVCVVGASNVDIQGTPEGALLLRDSNIGAVGISLGGVGRNIAENLTRLGVETRLISAVGDDAYGRRILEDARAIGLNMQDTLVLPGEASSVYMCILDEAGDMAAAINDMAIYERITADFIRSKKHVLENAALCVLDTNLPAAVLEHILCTFKNTVFFLDPVSAAKAVRAKDFIGALHTVKPNRLEAEVLSGVPIQNDGDLRRAAQALHNKGVRQVFITLGARGVYCSTQEGGQILAAPSVKPVSATGAGDAFMAGLVLGYLREYDAAGSARLATAAAALALMSEKTINPALSPKTLSDKAKEL